MFPNPAMAPLPNHQSGTGGPSNPLAVLAAAARTLATILDLTLAGAPSHPSASPARRASDPTLTRLRALAREPVVTPENARFLASAADHIERQLEPLRQRLAVVTAPLDQPRDESAAAIAALITTLRDLRARLVSPDTGSA